MDEARDGTMDGLSERNQEELGNRKAAVLVVIVVGFVGRPAIDRTLANSLFIALLLSLTCPFDAAPRRCLVRCSGLLLARTHTHSPLSGLITRKN